MKDGIFVKKMGGGQVDVVSGNFAFEVTECYRIRDGKLAEPCAARRGSARGQSS